MLKTIKIPTIAPICFGSRRNHHQRAISYLTKTAIMILLCSSLILVDPQKQKLCSRNRSFMSSKWTHVSLVRSQNFEKQLLASSCLSLCPDGTTRLPLAGFSWNCEFKYEHFLKSCQVCHGGENFKCLWSLRGGLMCNIPSAVYTDLSIKLYVSGFGSLGVSALASGTQVRGFKPGWSRRIFQGEKFLSAPSFGREIKPWVPCRWFTELKDP
jgi:hypothetical protein